MGNFHIKGVDTNGEEVNINLVDFCLTISDSDRFMIELKRNGSRVGGAFMDAVMIRPISPTHITVEEVANDK